MFGRVQAQARAIRAASKPMAEYASRASQLQHGAAEAATRAASALPGFMCADAAATITEDIRLDMSKLGEHLADTAEVLEDHAVHWDLADAATAAEFEQIAAALNSPSRPGD